MSKEYLLKRILSFFPFILTVIFVTILLGHLAGEKPYWVLDSQQKGQFTRASEERLFEELNLNEPLFYCSIDFTPFIDSQLKVFVPTLIWNGKANRFHRYTASYISGDFGFSSIYRQPVFSVLVYPLFITIIINAIVLVLTYLIAIPLGYYSVLFPRRIFTKVLQGLSQLFYAMPSFWLAILLLWLFANPDNFKLLPYQGWPNNDIDKFFPYLKGLATHLILPLLSLTLGGIAFIAILLKAKMEEELALPYVLAAKSRGMSKREIIKNVVFRNSLIPIVARFSSLFPALISGSIIIENIFSIPGMGKLLFESFLSRDLSVVYAITIITAMLTWLSWILTDFLLTKVDPRISF